MDEWIEGSRVIFREGAACQRVVKVPLLPNGYGRGTSHAMQQRQRQRQQHPRWRRDGSRPRNGPRKSDKHTRFQRVRKQRRHWPAGGNGAPPDPGTVRNRKGSAPERKKGLSTYSADATHAANEKRDLGGHRLSGVDRMNDWTDSFLCGSRTPSLCLLSISGFISRWKKAPCTLFDDEWDCMCE